MGIHCTYSAHSQKGLAKREKYLANSSFKFKATLPAVPVSSAFLLPVGNAYVITERTIITHLKFLFL